MYDRHWLKDYQKRLPEALDRELERRLGMEKKDCDTCQFENTTYPEEPCEACINSGKSGSNWQPKEQPKSHKQPNPLLTQIGGSHYKNFAIQPAEFITKNKLTWLEGCVVKRMCRRKGNRLEDLQKAKHEIDLIIELEGYEQKTQG